MYTYFSDTILTDLTNTEMKNKWLLPWDSTIQPRRGYLVILTQLAPVSVSHKIPIHNCNFNEDNTSIQGPLQLELDVNDSLEV